MRLRWGRSRGGAEDEDDASAKHRELSTSKQLSLEAVDAETPDVGDGRGGRRQRRQRRRAMAKLGNEILILHSSHSHLKNLEVQLHFLHLLTK